MFHGNFWKKSLIIAPALALCFGAGIFIDKVLLQEKCSSDFKFINQELWCAKTYKIEKHEYTVLKNDISSYLDEEKAAGRLTRAGVYFRDLENGPIFGIDEKEKFVPASLLKLPLMLTYFGLAEDNSALLTEKLGFTWELKPEQEQFFPPLRTIQPNNSYTIEDLLFNMIAFSDNASYLVLFEHLRDISPSENLILETFQDIGIIEPGGDFDETLSAKSYASIFRLLYNVSYLSKDFSEKALAMLAASDFNGGIMAGIPNGVTVAHKFGERFNLPNDQKELHDCGVIYYPGNPYLFCIMTEGYNFPELLTIIKSVSKMTYDEVNSRRL